MIQLLYGEDELSRSEALQALRASLADPALGDLNTVTLEGRRLSIGELRNHADTLPFLSDKRVVIVEDLMAQFNPGQSTQAVEDESDEGDSQAVALGARSGKGEGKIALKEDLLAYFPQLPPSTELILSESGTVARNNPILRFLESKRGIAQVRRFDALKIGQLPGWIHRRVEQKGGQIEREAIQELAAAIGADLRMLDSELEKLLSYRPGQRITAADVRALVAPVQEQSIFELVDALGRRQTAIAIKLVHEKLVHSAAPQYLLVMIERQIRLILQMRDLRNRQVDLEEAREKTGLQPLPARKAWEQAGNFTLEQLEEIYHALLELDLQVKTSRIDPGVALDVLLVESTRMKKTTA